MEDGKDKDPTMQDRDNSDSSAPSQNPLAGTLGISIFVPDIEIELVELSVLNDYETWALASSASFSAAIAILVAIIQSGPSLPLSLCGVLFVILFVAFFVAARKKRQHLKQKRRRVEFFRSISDSSLTDDL